MASADALLYRNFRLLDPAAGRLQDGYEMLVEQGQIARLYAGSIEAARAFVIDCGGRTLMPGLMDCHVTLSGTADGRPRSNGSQSRFAATEIGTAATLRSPLMEVGPAIQPATEADIIGALGSLSMRGFSAVRDAGGISGGLRSAVAQGHIRGPRLFVARHVISATHLTSLSDRDGYRLSLRCTCCDIPAGDDATAKDRIRFAARDHIRCGADHLMVDMTDWQAMLPADELQVVVEEAQSAGRYVSAKVDSLGAIRRALEVGVRTIEGGSGLDEASAALMAERGMLLVPMLSRSTKRVDAARHERLPSTKIDARRRAVDQSVQAIERAKIAGVPIAFGSGMNGDEPTAQADELEQLSRVLSCREVILAATTTAASLLRMTDRLGSLAVGAEAVFAFVEGDPFADIAVMAQAGCDDGAFRRDGTACQQERAFRHKLTAPSRGELRI